MNTEVLARIEAIQYYSHSQSLRNTSPKMGTGGKFFDCIQEWGCSMNGDHRDSGERAIRVLVADNSLIHTRLLADALQRDGGLAVIPCEPDASSLVPAATTQNIDVLLISSTLDEHHGQGLEILQEVRRLRPDIRAVLLLDSSKDDVVLQAFRAGARGVFGRNDPIELLSSCVRRVHQGEIWANSHHLSIAVGALANSPMVRAVSADGMNLLSERELQVVRCLAEGMTNREIAERMNLSQHTVKNYLFRVFDKLGVSSRVELLFMTLNHDSSEPASLRASYTTGHDKGHKISPREMDALKKSAEAGVPTAQLALAQLYSSRRGDSRDLVAAYMWYLIATERALQAQEFVTKTMTPEQIEEAKQKARLWLSKKPPASSSAGPHTKSDTIRISG
jgi:two-component system, NarL family, nitrate/nitrite response regulator NarL